MLQIYCKNNNSTKDFAEGSSLLDIYKGFNLQMPYGPVSAKVNNKVESLDFRVYYNKDIEFLDITSPSGMRTYVRSLCFIPRSVGWQKYHRNLLELVAAVCR